eukprot:TRINITY_DN801_c0_g1_i1.p1 TRINITY_DN801_c0_g1~~TRINITY_DN801_c0_g1_i1.p1  ORF type:complete len:247 (-),score=69.38 TRINITY_DN801_c0_g1_i1:218-958(-)
MDSNNDNNSQISPEMLESRNMTKNDAMPVTVSPEVLNFPPPLNRVILNTLQLTNKTDEYVAFKIKTTAPKRYIVRPNVGLIAPKKSHEIQVSLHFSRDPPAQAKATKDRFLVQTITKSNIDPNTDMKELWKSAEGTDKDIKRIKIKCTFQQQQNTSNIPPRPTSPVNVGDKDILQIKQQYISKLEDMASQNAQAQENIKNLKNQVVDLKKKIKKLEAQKKVPNSSPNLVILIIIALVSLLIGYYIG